MDWILLRHGVALPRESRHAPRDPDRPLTDKGHQRTRSAVRGLIRLGLDPDVVITSPYRRAYETADHVLGECGRAGPRSIRMIETPTIEPMREPNEVESVLLGIENAGQVVLTGHAPHLDRLAEHLVGASVPRLKKAGAVWLSQRHDPTVVDPGRTPDRIPRSLAHAAELRAWFAPRFLRRMDGDPS